jgi:hypothetical protein
MPTNFNGPEDNRQVEDAEVVDSTILNNSTNMGEKESKWSVPASVSSMFESIKNIPTMNRFTAKIGIAYNQFFIDKKEGKQIDLKDRMDDLDLNLKNLNESKQKMQQVIENLKNGGETGYSSMILEVKNIEKKELEESNKKDRLQSKIEKRENKIKLYTNKRDKIANTMVEKYDKKLSPIEENLENLETERNMLEMFKVGKEAEIEGINDRINFIDKQKQIVVEGLLAQGITADKIDRNIHVIKFTKDVNSYINQILDIRLNIEKRSENINKKIEKADKKANPYKDRRNEFIRITEKRPIKINLEERANLNQNEIREETIEHTRIDNPETNTPKFASFQTTVDSGYQESGDRIKFYEILSGYNSAIKEDGNNNGLLINEAIAYKTVNRNVKFTKEKFVEFAKAYYQMKKVPKTQYEEIFNNLTK